MLRQLAHPQLEQVHDRAGPLMCLPYRIPRGSRLGAFIAGCVEGSFSRVRPVAGRVEGFLGMLRAGRVSP
jgi:hypothetical protein